MTQRMMVRSLTVTLLGLALFATPAFAAGPERPADSPRSGWIVEFGGLVSRAMGLFFDDWAGERSEPRQPRRDRSADESDSGIRSISGEEGSDWDPNG